VAHPHDIQRETAVNPGFDAGGPTTARIRVARLARRTTLAALAAVLAVSFGGQSTVGAQRLACKPTVTVTNLRPGGSAAIKIVTFKYKVAVSGNTIFTEGLSNKILTDGHRFEDWPSQTLSHAATGNVITETAVEFKVDNGPGWGPPITSAWFPHTFTCDDGHHYNHELR
jgi:hypothetical protein